MIRGHISNLGILGFRRFQAPFEQSFVGPTGVSNTLIVAGPNGSGKTSLFEAILYALGREHLILGQLADDDQRHWLGAALAADVRITLVINVSSAPGTILGTRAPCSVTVTRTRSLWQVTVGTDGAPIAEGEEGSRALLGELPVEWFSSWRQPYLPGAVAPMSSPPSDVRGESSRLWRVKQRFVDERARSAFQSAPGIDLEWLARLGHAWATLRGDDGTSFALTADEADEARTHFDLVLKRVSPDLGELILCSVDQLSSGEIEWVTIAGTLITGHFDGIVLIDEPELHLNPDWQARVLPTLRELAPQSQLILASHADAPWDQAYSFERVLLVPPDDPRAKSAG
jgi:energy-coupling factor transporter ATP-binding protein EcfA2